MNHVDLCSGIGGFAKAAQQMGWQTIAFCERELFCHQVLRKKFGNIPIFNDLHNLTYAAIRSVYRHYGYAAPDIGAVTAGLPCQPFSGAGKQLGRKDERHLFPAFLNFIRSCGKRKPKFIVLENVRRLVSIEDHSIGLADKISLLPTPDASGGKEAGLKLQANFVEWMMGYPLNWTLPSAPWFTTQSGTSAEKRLSAGLELIAQKLKTLSNEPTDSKD